VIRFDHGEVDAGFPDFDGERGESGAGTDVENSGQWAVVGGQREEVSGQK